MSILLALALVTAPPSDKDAQKVIKTVITAIQHGKDDLAAKQIAFGPMIQKLMGPEWAQASDADKKELTAGIEAIVRGISFVKGREMFEHLDAVLYDKVRPDGDAAKCKATVVVNRAYKKAEVNIDFVLVQDGGAWKIVDTVMLGESTLAGVRETQIEPLLQKGGVPAVMEALRAKVGELKPK
jgi:phospholipid transport system substrate-binding protein